ncbi:MAG: hypothetical protein IPG50_26850 [Myxococcales bacterium]|nr:hypothetical protein [Myxococcales bacterium]
MGERACTGRQNRIVQGVVVRESLQFRIGTSNGEYVIVQPGRRKFPDAEHADDVVGLQPPASP